VERRTVHANGIEVELTRLEFDLLHRLLVNHGRVLTRERLLEQAWGWSSPER
jgi:DNA-binding response OmpR family regulator